MKKSSVLLSFLVIGMFGCASTDTGAVAKKEPTPVVAEPMTDSQKKKLFRTNRKDADDNGNNFNSRF